MHFGSRHFTFLNRIDGKKEGESLKSCYIGLPLSLKVAAPRYNNFRPYVMGGVQPMVELIPNKGKKIRTTPFNAALELGLGCDIYLPFFKLIPELKFTFGLTNILDKKRTDFTDNRQREFTDALDAAHNNMVTLTFYFE